MRTSPSLYRFALATLLAVTLAGAGVAQSPRHTLVSKEVTGTGAGNGESGEMELSDDGHLLVFASNSTDLTNDLGTSTARQIYLYDRGSDTVKLVSQSVSGELGDDDSFAPVISADGLFIAFQSRASDLTNDTDNNASLDIYLYDVTLGTTILVSKSVSGGTAERVSYDPRISGDGRYVTFTSPATDLTNDTNNNGTTGAFAAEDIYLFDRVLGTVVLVSESRFGNQTGNAASLRARVSRNGTYVVFQSGSTDLTADTNNNGTSYGNGRDIYLYEVGTGAITLVSRATTGGTGNFLSGLNSFDPDNGPGISADGNFISFESVAQDLTADVDTGFTNDVFIYDRVADSLTLVSKAITGGVGTGTSIRTVMAPNGGFVAFTSMASDLTSDTNNSLEDVYLYDRVADSLTLVSRSVNGGTGERRSNKPKISTDGSYVAFLTEASDLTNDTDNNGGIDDAVLYERATGTLTLLSTSTTGGSGNDRADGLWMSAGRFVALQSEATDHTTDPDPNGDPLDVFLIDLESADLSLLLNDSQDPVAPGLGTFDYELQVDNLGAVEAFGVKVTTALPTDVTLVSTVGCLEDPFGVPSCILGNLAAGFSAAYSITVAPNPSGTGVLMNTATVSSGTFDPVGGNDSETEETTLVPLADLAVTVTDDEVVAFPGEAITYTLTVTQNGPSDAPATAVLNTFPPGLTGIAWQCVASAGSSCTASGSGDIADTADVLVGGTVTYTATGTVAANFLGVLTNEASVAVAPGIGEIDPSNNSSIDTTTVAPGPGVSGAKSVVGDCVPGGVLTYTIVLTNGTEDDQPGDPADPQLTDALPAELLLLSVTSDSGVVNSSGDTAFWAGSIESGGRVTITIEAEIRPDVGDEATIANQGQIFYDADGDGTNDTIAFTDDPTLPGSEDTTLVCGDIPLFSDGFESGDASAWTLSFP